MRAFGKTVKINCTPVRALSLCTGRKAHRGSRGIALPFHDHSTRRGRVVSFMPRPFFTPGKDPVPIVQEAGWVPGPVWTGAENLDPTGIRSPDRPARSQSLYQLSYLVYLQVETCSKFLSTSYTFTYLKTLHLSSVRKCKLIRMS